MSEPADSGAVEATPHVLRLLEGAQRRIARELELELAEAVRQVGPRRLRLLQLIPAGGARQQDLAAAALVSKQALAELVDALEAAGLVVRTPDSLDGRARVIRRTPSGTAVNDAVDRAMLAVEARLQDEIGVERYQGFAALLQELGLGNP